MSGEQQYACVRVKAFLGTRLHLGHVDLQPTTLDGEVAEMFRQKKAGHKKNDVPDEEPLSEEWTKAVAKAEERVQAYRARGHVLEGHLLQLLHDYAMSSKCHAMVCKMLQAHADTRLARVREEDPGSVHHPIQIPPVVGDAPHPAEAAFWTPLRSPKLVTLDLDKKNRRAYAFQRGTAPGEPSDPCGLLCAYATVAVVPASPGAATEYFLGIVTGYNEGTRKYVVRHVPNTADRLVLAAQLRAAGGAAAGATTGGAAAAHRWSATHEHEVPAEKLDRVLYSGSDVPGHVSECMSRTFRMGQARAASASPPHLRLTSTGPPACSLPPAASLAHSTPPPRPALPHRTPSLRPVPSPRRNSSRAGTRAADSGPRSSTPPRWRAPKGSSTSRCVTRPCNPRNLAAPTLLPASI